MVNGELPIVNWELMLSGHIEGSVQAATLVNKPEATRNRCIVYQFRLFLAKATGIFVKLIFSPLPYYSTCWLANPPGGFKKTIVIN